LLALICHQNVEMKGVK